MLRAPLKVKGHVVIVSPHQQCNMSSMNGYQLNALKHYLRGGENAELDTLHVEQAQFEVPPSYEKLNGRKLQQLLDELWLDNEFVELQAAQLSNATFNGLLAFEVSCCIKVVYINSCETIIEL